MNVCKYCQQPIKEDEGYYSRYNDKDVAHPKCYYNFIGGNKLNLDWYKTL